MRKHTFEKALHRIGMIASACCAVHCMVTPLIILAIPAIGSLPEAWHDYFIWSSVGFGLLLTLRTIIKAGNALPFLFAMDALGIFVVMQLFETHNFLGDALIGILLSVAHWTNHRYGFCEHKYQRKGKADESMLH